MGRRPVAFFPNIRQPRRQMAFAHEELHLYLLVVPRGNSKRRLLIQRQRRGGLQTQRLFLPAGQTPLHLHQAILKESYRRPIRLHRVDLYLRLYHPATFFCHNPLMVSEHLANVDTDPRYRHIKHHRPLQLGRKLFSIIRIPQLSIRHIVG